MIQPSPAEKDGSSADQPSASSGRHSAAVFDAAMRMSTAASSGPVTPPSGENAPSCVP